MIKLDVNKPKFDHELQVIYPNLPPNYFQVTLASILVQDNEINQGLTEIPY